VIGFRALEVSANAQMAPLEGEQETGDGQEAQEGQRDRRRYRALWAGTVVVAFVLQSAVSS